MSAATISAEAPARASPEHRTLITICAMVATLMQALDSTIANVMDFFVGFSISSGSNVVQVQHYTVEALN
jgi:DHA2 family multidrug resistance protein